ncbi:MAG TPA: acylphosphatase [Phycisphaerae bacterium]|nr:acylphosphatase [Phycisphaerae bacterium]
MAERRTIVFSGRVQGVGFRMTTVEMADDMELGGTVRNLEDGSVELVAEGEGEQINRLVARLREHFGTFIRNIRETSAPATGMSGGGIRIEH